MTEDYKKLSVKLQRTVNAAYHALLEMTAWMGIPEPKRHAQIEYLMSNVKYCSEHDLSHLDESNRNLQLKNELDAKEKIIRDAIEFIEEIMSFPEPEIKQKLRALKLLLSLKTEENE